MGAHARIKAVLQYRATPGFLRQIAALEDESLTIVVVPETDKQAFAREMHDTDVLLHESLLCCGSLAQQPHEAQRSRFWVL